MTSIWQRQLTIRIVTILFFVMCLLLVRNAWNIWSTTRQPVVNDDSLEAEREKNAELKQDIGRWSEDFQKEMVIREELNMQKENESVLQVPPFPSVTSNPLPTPTPTPSNLQEWGSLLL